MVCYSFSDLFWYITRLWNKEKKQTNKKTSYYFKKKKKDKKKKLKKFDMRPPGIEPGLTDSESDVLTTLPSMHMALTRDRA